MRKFHRWFSIVAGLFLIFVAATGVALQIDMMLAGNPPPGTGAGPGPGGPQESRPQAPPGLAAEDDALRRMLDTTLVAARRQPPAFAVERIELHLTGPGAGQGVLASGEGPAAKKVTVDLASGRILPAPPPKKEGLHFVLQNLHAFYVFGPVGQWVSMAIGVALLVLSVTGLWVYLDMFRRRFRAGRKALFWK